LTGLRAELFQRYKDENRLHGVLVELTHRCPCDCRHCLLLRQPRDELSATEFADLFAQLSAEGVFNVGLTGGEPLLRDDLPAILEAAHEHRFILSILTTGILVGSAEAALFQRCRVRSAELSLLGAGAATHDDIMRFPGAFARTVQAAKRLRDAGIVVTLKATVMRPNRSELPAMAELARRLGVRFAANVSVAPRVDGDPSPLNLALDPKELSTVDLRLVQGGLIPAEEHVHGAMLICQAGRTIAGVTPEGDVLPCILFRRPVGHLRERRLQSIWHDDPDPFLTTLRSATEADAAECAVCDLRSHCRRCPGVAFSETNRLGEASPSACALARGLARARQRQDSQAAGFDEPAAKAPK
jgi:pyrroloquinoline quinone biosynthesis protein E